MYKFSSCDAASTGLGWGQLLTISVGKRRNNPKWDTQSLTPCTKKQFLMNYTEGTKKEILKHP